VKSVRTIALLLLSLSFLAATSFAAQPLKEPWGLAVDAKGNLYVSNFAANQVLVYNVNYKQMPAKTITSGISSPTGLAFDPLGNLWVANFTGSVTEYGPTGVQDTTRTITNGIFSPYNIATDGLGDILVNNNFSNLTIYPQFGNAPAKSINFSTAITGLGTYKMWSAYGSNTTIGLREISLELSGAYAAGADFGQTGYAIAFDTTGKLYSANLDGSLTVIFNGGLTSLTQLGYRADGIAVDSVRGRIYVSSANGNFIQVYSTAGTLLTTLK